MTYKEALKYMSEKYNMDREDMARLREYGYQVGLITDEIYQTFLNKREISKEEAMQLPIGTEYIVYNPLTESESIEKASLRDIVHNKYCYEKLRFYINKENK